MNNATLKKAGDDIRERLRIAQANGTLPKRGPDDRYDSVRYDVRASSGGKNGTPKVNITISGFEGLIPDAVADAKGGLKQWADTEGAALIAAVEKVAARQRFVSIAGDSALGGETKFGPYIKVTATTVRHETNA